MPDGTLIPATTAPTNAAGCGEAGVARPLVARQLAALGEFVDIGLNIARAIERQVSAAEPQPLADLNAAAMAYARVARAVRQSILLQSRLVEPRATPEKAEGVAADSKAAARARLDRALRREIEAGQGDREQVERLVAEAAERLEPALDGEQLDRPLHEIVAAICRDLGLRPDWPRLFPELAAVEEALSGEGGDASGPVELYWLDPEGFPAPASALCHAADDAGARRDSS